MEFKKFESGNHFSIGVELELRILDILNLSPQNEFDYINSNIDKKFAKNIAKEFLSSMIEINTPIFYSEEELISYLKDITQNINSILKKRDLVLHTNGTYAQKCINTKISDNIRYQEIYNEHRVLLDNFAICGTHVHIGFQNFDKALKAYNYSIYYLPLFLALSASSVFYNGKNTGIHSYRTKIFERLPKASIPDYFDSYEQMKSLFDLLYDCNVIDSIKDIWWDVRIQPKFQTIEFRMCDAIKDFDRLEVIVSLFKVICRLSEEEEITKMPMQVLKQNLWSAARHSMDGEMITKEGVVSIRDMLKEIVKKALKKGFLSEKLAQKAEKIIDEKSVSQKMLEIYEKSKNLKDIELMGVFK